MKSDADHHQSDLPATEDLSQLLLLLGGYRISQALYVIVKLGIPDLLADGPDRTDALAQATSTNADALYRVLRFLAGVGILEEVAPEQFGLTRMGKRLCTDVPGSMRATALMLLDPANWQSWGQLLSSVQTGEMAFHQAYGMDYFAYLEQHPDVASVFQQAMTSNTIRSGAVITHAYNFSGIEQVVDIGGGQGMLLSTLLQVYPTMRGILFDRPSVVAGAPAILEAAGIADRCKVVGGDFFVAVPADGDVYILRQILHDWDNAHAVTILESCRHAMTNTGKVLVIERVIAPDYREALPVLHLDLEMLVNFGGRQRTEADYAALFTTAGFRLSAVIPIGDPGQFSIFEGVPN